MALTSGLWVTEGHWSRSVVSAAATENTLLLDTFHRGFFFSIAHLAFMSRNHLVYCIKLRRNCFSVPEQRIGVLQCKTPSALRWRHVRLRHLLTRSCSLSHCMLKYTLLNFSYSFRDKGRGQIRDIHYFFTDKAFADKSPSIFMDETFYR